MLKKILATALAAAMILGLASVAFAASFSDTADSAKESSIKRLAGLGLLNGYPDGSFRPENPITRAEFAKVIVYALGLKDAADMLSGVPVGFPDVPANHWATGYISIASSQLIVNGYPDGTFRPEANVTYAEAVTMIMRALGYEPILKNGTWPTAYLTKAATLGVTKGVSFNASANATRANVAALVSNAMTKGRLVESGYVGDNIQYEVDNNSTLLSLMGAEKATGWLIDSPELFDNEGSVSLVLTAEYAPLGARGEIDDEVEFDIADDTDYAGLIGHEVSVWLNNDGDVFFIEDQSDKVEAVADIYTNGHTVELKNEDDYDLNEYPDALVFKNYMADGTVGGGIALNDDDVVTLVFDGKDVASIIVLDYEFKVVNSVSVVYDRITFKPSGSLRLPDYDVTWSGAAAELADLEENDVVQYIVNSTEEKAVVIVTRNAVTGDFTRLSPATNASVTVDGKKYTEALGYNVPSLLGDEVTILLNMFGKVQMMFEVEEAESDEYVAVVVNSGVKDGVWADTGIVRLFTAAGETVELECTTDVYDGTNWSVDLHRGDLVTYELTSKGKIDVIEVQALFSTYETDIVVDADNKLITADIGTVKLSSSTVIFDMGDFVQLSGGVWSVKSSADEDDLDVLSLSKLLGNDDVQGLVYGKSGKATIVALFTGSADAETYFGWASGKYEEKDDEIAAILAEGVTSEYVLSGSADLGDFSKSKVVTFELGGDKITSISNPLPLAVTQEAAEDVAEWRVVDIDGEVVEVAQFYTDEYSDANKVGEKVPGTTRFLLVNSDTLFYDYTGSIKSIELEDVSLDSVVEIHLNGGVLAVLVIID